MYLALCKYMYHLPMGLIVSVISMLVAGYSLGYHKRINQNQPIAPN